MVIESNLYKLLFGVILLFLCVNLVTAQDVIVQQNTYKDLTITCVNNETYCSTTAVCNTTIVNPNGKIVVNNKPMTKNGVAFNYTVNSSNTDTIGEYLFNPVCLDGYTQLSKSLTFQVTPNGQLTTTGASILYSGAIMLILILIVISIFSFTKSTQPAMKLLSFYFIWLFFILLFYLSWITTTNYLYAFSFLGRFFYWIFIIQLVGTFPMVLTTLGIYLWMVIYNKNIQRMIEHGVPEDEAYARSVSGGMKKIRREGRNKW
jgi:hypothetical protein